MGVYRYLKYILIVLIIGIININLFCFTVDAAPYNLKYKTFALKNDVNLKGVFSSHSLYFTVDKYMQVDSLEANIFFSLSELITNEEKSTLTLSINGNYFYSVGLSYNDSQDIQTFKVTIPTEMVKYGSNVLNMEIYKRISDKPCTDDVNNGNWITLKGESNVVMAFTDKESTNSISEFTYPFIKVNEESQYNSVIAIPDNYKEGELTAALMLQTYLGKGNEDKNYDGIIVKYSNIPEDKDIIYLGGINDLPEKLKPLYKDLSKEDYNNCAVIKKNDSPFNSNNKIMTVISENSDMLVKSAKLLMNKDLTAQLNEDTFKVDKNIEVDNNLSQQKSKITFKDMGINQLDLKGPFTQSASLSYSLPVNRKLSKGAKINVFMRYSQNLDFNRSLATIYVNNTPIGSKKLDKDRCNGDELELAIPTDINVSNFMDIKIVFDLEQVNSNCEFREEETPWALVTGESYIYVPTNKLNFYEFSTYPQPFISEGQFNDVALVVPKDLSENEIEGISKIFSYMGRYINYNTGTLKVIKEDNFSDKYNNMNLIVYGTPERNKLVKNMNSNMWFKYNDSYNSFTRNEKLYLTEPYNSNISIFQFDVSPYNKNKAVLLVTSPKQDLLLNSLMFLSYEKQIAKLSGDCVIIDNFGNISTFKFKKQNTESIYDKFKDIGSSAKGFMIFMGLFIFFIVISIVLYKFKNKKFK